jgi:iron(III) transport system ATP-binding protein
LKTSRRKEGTPDDLYRRPQSRFLADFIGDADLIEGSITIDGEGVSFRRDGVELTLGRCEGSAIPTLIALRPDRIELSEDATSPISVQRVAFVGAAHEYTLQAPWGEVMVVRPSHEPCLPVGSHVRLKPHPGAAVLLS